MPSADVVLCHPLRTPIGKFGGTLKSTPAPELGATIVRALLKQSGLAPEKVDTAVFGQSGLET